MPLTFVRQVSSVFLTCITHLFVPLLLKLFFWPRILHLFSTGPLRFCSSFTYSGRPPWFLLPLTMSSFPIPHEFLLEIIMAKICWALTMCLALVCIHISLNFHKNLMYFLHLKLEREWPNSAKSLPLPPRNLHYQQSLALPTLVQVSTELLSSMGAHVYYLNVFPSRPEDRQDSSVQTRIPDTSWLILESLKM